MRTGLGIALAAGLQTLALVGMIGVQQYTLNEGTPVLLETEPIDPRSLFRGDFVILNYAISDLPRRLPGGELDWRRRDSAPCHHGATSAALCSASTNIISIGFRRALAGSRRPR